MITPATIIMIFSVLFQLIAAFFALRLIRVTKKQKAWIFLVIALFLMIVRRLLSLYTLIAGINLVNNTLLFETIGLFISFFVLLGVAYIAPIFISIQESKEKLKESEEKYRTVFENTGTATVIVEENTVISLANNGFERLSGYSKEEIENKMKWTDFVIPEDLERMKKHHITRRKSGEKAPTEYEFRFIGKKGNLKDIFLKI
ncbi:MAG: PAS domain S-box protein [Candidatus Atribacteria bacterium]|nr:PAS domain S-box protein [Candidatus Atribacteria bacterium]